MLASVFGFLSNHFYTRKVTLVIIEETDSDKREDGCVCVLTSLFRMFENAAIIMFAMFSLINTGCWYGSPIVCSTFTGKNHLVNCFLFNP